MRIISRISCINFILARNLLNYLSLIRSRKTRAGVYFFDAHRIRIYAPWGHLKETAIHEYAHHIHYTECGSKAHGERPHGPQFWEIYGALMCVAVQKGLYVEERIEKIAKL